MNTIRQCDKLASSLYSGPGQRNDCCARCANSRVVGGKLHVLVCRRHGSAIVANMGYCADWKPMTVRVMVPA